MFGWLITRMLPVVPMRIVRAVASRYVAGEDLDSAREVVRRLAAEGYHATIDILGENAADDAHADETVEGYRQVLRMVEQERFPANISVKPSHLGIRLDESRAEARLLQLLDDVSARGSFLRIDMEDSSLTDATFRLYRKARERSPAVGTVIQAYLRRTVEDAKALAAEGSNLRLCKGIYRESPSIAWQKREDIRKSYLETARILLSAPGTYVAFATHDRVLLDQIPRLSAEMDIPKDRFEFQALLGVPVEDVLKPLVEQGYKVRWYVPFGVEWYPYSVRRLKENPKMATYIVRHWFSP
ncbi:proline dehydrogenase family protein [Myxococcota bacterium]|nr:proline dehydrogenase family protein [Myxococcota bacterium]